MSGDREDPRFAPPPEPGASADELELAEGPARRRPRPRLLGSDAPYRPPAAKPEAPTPAEAEGTALRAARGSAAILLAPLAVLLPARWRACLGVDAVPLAAGAVVQGLAQVAFVMIAFYLLVRGVNERHVAPNHDALLDYIAFASDPELALRGLQATGMATWLYVLASWPGLACLYLLVEALVRLLAVGVTGDALPSGPLVLVDRGARAFVRWRDERRLPPLVADAVARSAGGAHLEIASCRARDWPVGTVLLVDDEAWRVAGLARHAGAARPFVYRLTRAPAGQIVRAGRVYRADELVAAAGRGATSSGR